MEPRRTFTDYQTQIEQIRRLGECLCGGEFIESPFDEPVEEERRGDPDQSDDDQRFPADVNICTTLEPELTEGKQDISAMEYEPRLIYFLDGSLRTKYLGEYIHEERAFPILATEVSCAVVRKNERYLEPIRREKRLVFIFPHRDTGLVSDTVYERLLALNEIWIQQNNLLRIEFLARGAQETRDVRYSMLGRARYTMRTLEHEVAQSLTRNNDWLVMDGAIRIGEFLNLENTIGLAKSFSRKPTFDLGDGNPLMITTYLSRVRDGERSAVFKKENEEVAFWYVRLRTYPPMEPLGGLVKVDFHLEENELSQDLIHLINEISAELYAFRSPSLYPLPRWPSLIYPIRLTELMMRSTFINIEMLGSYGRELRQTIRGGNAG